VDFLNITVIPHRDFQAYSFTPRNGRDTFSQNYLIFAVNKFIHFSNFSCMHTRNIIAVILLIISLICLVPGLMQPILSLKIGAALPLVGTLTLHESTQSILKTIETLNENNNALVAFLILLFSVIVPVFKAVSLLSVLLIKKLRNHSRLHKFIALISKWSMADVFVVGVFIAFLSTQSNEALEAKLGMGFYWFLAYCLISIAASQVMITEKA